MPAKGVSNKACKPVDWVRRGESVQGVEHIEAFFQGKAYGMHRHDTYAIGRTLGGVQSFNYRSSLRNSLPGDVIVLHPDERHDGQAGHRDGFHYRMVYVEPSLIQAALGGRSLPFIEGGSTNDLRLRNATAALLQSVSSSHEALEHHEGIEGLALALAAASNAPEAQRTKDYVSAQRVREFLDANLCRAVRLEEVETAVGRDRWSLSRDFRAYFGTSPYRYLTMRRLGAARQMMLRGTALAESAVAVGFADQSHMTRHFLQAYGLSPARWLRTLRALRSC
ncbi:MAG: AraC family transcriptional regulator [Hydrogenophaga sp.]